MASKGTSVIRMLLTGLFYTVILTTIANGFPTDIHVPGWINPESTVTVNCSFDRTYEQTSLVFIYNSTKDLVYLYNFIEGSGSYGPGFQDMVSDPTAMSGWFSINFTFPLCYKDDTFICNVFDWNWEVGQDSSTFLIALPDIPQPRIYVDGVCRTCSEDESQRTLRLSKEDAGNATLECRLEGALPEATLTWDNPFKPIPGDDTSVEDPDTCTFTQTSTATGTVYKETHTGCWANSEIGHTRSRSLAILPYRGVELLLPDEMEKSSPMTVNCTFELALEDTHLVAIWDDNGFGIYVHLFFRDEGEIGGGFEDMVSNPRVGENGGWVAFDFLMPACYKDDMFGCTVQQTGGVTLGIDRRTFKQIYKVTN